jgi:hypothetical protein
MKAEVSGGAEPRLPTLCKSAGFDRFASWSRAESDADPAIATATIWQRLADDHGTTVAYPTLRTYVVGRRSAPTS